MASWQDDYYLGSCDYPRTGADDDLDPELFDDLAAVEVAE